MSFGEVWGNKTLILSCTCVYHPSNYANELDFSQLWVWKRAVNCFIGGFWAYEMHHSLDYGKLFPRIVSLSWNKVNRNFWSVIIFSPFSAHLKDLINNKFLPWKSFHFRISGLISPTASFQPCPPPPCLQSSPLSHKLWCFPPHWIYCWGEVSPLRSKRTWRS